ncbi:MAG: pseudaminic acid synthase [Endomicrobiales bacterium]|nr:pseudaminic acid synthase [Endomicrobiales bacterium]
MKISKRSVGANAPVFIIAEMSANHNQDLKVALKTIKAAKEAGADAVKLQTYTADTLTIDCKNKYFRIRGGTLWDGKTLYNLYKQACTPWEWHQRLFRYAKKLGLVCFSTPFDRSAVDFLEKLKTPAHKIASFEITDIPLIEYAASKKKPMIISTGIAALSEIWDAVSACRRKGNNKLALLKCTSAYPARPEDMNLKTIPDMIKRFGVIVGLSDHTLGPSAAVAAVSLGAKIIEKHFILDRKLGGPDAAFSMEPAEFNGMVRAIRETEKALGNVTYKLSGSVRASRRFCRSLFAVKDIKKGETITEINVRSIRPGDGLSPKYLKKILKRRAKRSVKRGTPIKLGMIR